MESVIKQLSEELNLTRANAKSFRTKKDIRKILSRLREKPLEFSSDSLVSLNIELAEDLLFSTQGQLYLGSDTQDGVVAVTSGLSFAEARIRHITSIQIGPGCGQERPIVRINVSKKEEAKNEIQQRQIVSKRRDGTIQIHGEPANIRRGESGHNAPLWDPLPTNHNE